MQLFVYGQEFIQIRARHFRKLLPTKPIRNQRALATELHIYILASGKFVAFVLTYQSGIYHSFKEL